MKWTHEHFVIGDHETNGWLLLGDTVNWISHQPVIPYPREALKRRWAGPELALPLGNGVRERHSLCAERSRPARAGRDEQSRAKPSPERSRAAPTGAEPCPVHLFTSCPRPFLSRPSPSALSQRRPAHPATSPPALLPLPLFILPSLHHHHTTATTVHVMRSVRKGGGMTESSMFTSSRVQESTKRILNCKVTLSRFFLWSRWQ